MTSLLLFYSCCFRPNWLRPIHPQLRREPREKLAPLVLSFLTLFNLQGARPSSGTVTIISGSVSFVKYFFKSFSDFSFRSFKIFKHPTHSLHRRQTALLGYQNMPEMSSIFFEFFRVFCQKHFLHDFPHNIQCFFQLCFTIIQYHTKLWGDLLAVLENERCRQWLYHYK